MTFNVISEVVKDPQYSPSDPKVEKAIRYVIVLNFNLF